MSDYSRSKVIRCRIKSEWNLDVWDLESAYPNKFKFPCLNAFEVAPTEEPFIDYVLFHSYGEESGDFGFTRKLEIEEIEQYLPLFKEIIPNCTSDDLRYVDYCFYNCTEAPDYF